MTEVRCLATNCEFNTSQDEKLYGTCLRDNVNISVWSAEDDEYMACKSFSYGKIAKYRGEC